MTVPVITIDGPSGAGKGTISRMVAESTEYELLDSGALYRITGVACLKSNTNIEDHDAVAKLAKTLKIRFVVEGGKTRVLLDGDDVSKHIREEEAGMMASKVGAIPLVRQALLERQYDFRRAPGLVADGRDMGTVVFPDAPLKIFLTASAEERAKRRKLQLEESGIKADFEKILCDIEARDFQDRNRKTAPLVPAEDAIVIDCTAMTIDQVYKQIMSEVKTRCL